MKLKGNRKQIEGECTPGTSWHTTTPPTTTKPFSYTDYSFSPTKYILALCIIYSPLLSCILSPSSPPIFSNLPATGQMCKCFSLSLFKPIPTGKKKKKKGRGIFNFTPRETSFINFGSYTPVKKVSWLAWLWENVDSIPNNMILMSWKIPGPPEDRPDATVMRNATVLLKLPSSPFFQQRATFIIWALEHPR